MYDGIVPAALRHIELNAKLLTEVQAAVAIAAPQPDPFALARVRRDRKAALERYLEDRDADALAAAMARLDEAEAAATRTDGTAPDPAAVLAYLRNLPELFAAAEPDTQRRITRALFERVEVLGLSEVWLHPSVEAEANGWTAAMRNDASVYIESRSGRGERDSPATNDLPITMRLAEPPAPLELVRSA